MRKVTHFPSFLLWAIYLKVYCPGRWARINVKLLYSIESGGGVRVEVQLFRAFAPSTKGTSELQLTFKVSCLADGKYCMLTLTIY